MFKELGVELLDDLFLVHDEDLDALQLTEFEKRRFHKALKDLGASL